MLGDANDIVCPAGTKKPDMVIFWYQKKSIEKMFWGMIFWE
jgi:hypothetical protein